MKIRYVIFVLLFIVGIAIGFWTGVSLKLEKEPEITATEDIPPVIKTLQPTIDTVILPTATPGEQGSIYTLPSGQRSLLIIGVTEVNNPAAKLQSVWHIGYFPNSSQLVLIPIFPDPSARSDVHNQALADAFQLNARGEPIRRFWNELDARNWWWSGYVMVDPTGAARIINYLGSIDLGSGPIKGAAAVNRIVPWDKNPEKALEQQYELIEGVCFQFSQVKSVTNLDSLSNLIGKHMLTDFLDEQILVDMNQMLTYGKSFRCKFPLLEGANEGQPVQTTTP
jgi:hypothetical protein